LDPVGCSGQVLREPTFLIKQRRPNQTKKVLREPTFLIKQRRPAFNIGYKTAWNMLRHALILKGYLRVKIIIFQCWRSNWKVLTLLILSWDFIIIWKKGLKLLLCEKFFIETCMDGSGLSKKSKSKSNEVHG